VPTPVVVRPAEVRDLYAAGQVCVQGYLAAGQLDDDPHQGYGALLADTRARLDLAVLLVAEMEERIVGTVTICPPGSPFSELGREDEVEFRFLAVAPEAWGQGVGEALVEACESYARQQAARRIVICVRDFNDPAKALYLRRGFVRCPERDWEPVPGVSLLAMTRTF